jgi:hypothetical protein
MATAATTTDADIASTATTTASSNLAFEVDGCEIGKFMIVGNRPLVAERLPHMNAVVPDKRRQRAPIRDP